MNTLSKLFSFLLISILLLSCGTEKKIELFNGENLDNWNIFLASPEVAPSDVFWVEGGILNTSGEPFGYLRSKESYSNYKLHLEWRWKGEPTNSGVLLHVQGKDRIFPHCIECQLMHGKAGDIVLMGAGSGVSVRDSAYLVTSDEDFYMSIPKFEDSSEKTPGEWNSYDITSINGGLEILVNGVLQHTATDLTMNEGNIALQSEGSPLQFRNVYLQPL
jgi:hypothetical protein